MYYRSVMHYKRYGNERLMLYHYKLASNELSCNCRGGGDPVITAGTTSMRGLRARQLITEESLQAGQHDRGRPTFLLRLRGHRLQREDRSEYEANGLTHPQVGSEEKRGRDRVFS